MKDIIQSLNKAMMSQGWIYGDKLQRIGHPFEWVDGDNTPNFYGVDDSLAVMQYLTMFYEQYPTPNEIYTDDFDEMRSIYQTYLSELVKYFAPFVCGENGLNMFSENIDSTSLTRTQDYSFINTFSNLNDSINHLDIGSGLGTHSIYSLEKLNSNFYALEASPHSYTIQRYFFRFLMPYPGSYLDPIECENFGQSLDSICTELNTSNKYKLKHVPSWMFPLVEDSSIDLITATWVLNEVNYSGILWLISNASQVLRPDGYFYIRDSHKLKPNRHSINYDNLLEKIGFTKIQELDVQNRVDYFGIPRIYQKQTNKSYTFDELVDDCLGKFSLTALGGDYVQNLD